jgi:hypothetical protein
MTSALASGISMFGIMRGLPQEAAFGKIKLPKMSNGKKDGRRSGWLPNTPSSAIGG